MYTTLYLAHHGILGQKWGIRRYQNPDGTLTAAGKKRYYDVGINAGYKKSGKVRRLEKKIAVKESKGKNTTEIKKKLDFEMSKDTFRGARKDISKSRNIGSKLVANILAGPFANRTYNSMRAQGHGKLYSAGATFAVNALTGPIGHLAMSAIQTYEFAKDANRLKYLNNSYRR